MILDNILRTMNEYIKDIFDTFGGRSDEYMRAVRQVKETIPDNVLEQTVKQGLHYVADSPTQPLQFSRGKKSQEILNNFQTEVADLRAQQRETGTAAVQAQPYYIEQQIESPDTPVTRERLKQQSADRYYFDSNVNDWYKQIDTAGELTETEKTDIKDNYYANLNENYWNAKSRDDLQRKAEDLIAKIKQRRSLQQSQAAPVPKNPNVKGVMTSDITKIIK